MRKIRGVRRVNLTAWQMKVNTESWKCFFAIFFHPLAVFLLSSSILSTSERIMSECSWYTTFDYANVQSIDLLILCRALDTLIVQTSQVRWCIVTFALAPLTRSVSQRESVTMNCHSSATETTCYSWSYFLHKCVFFDRRSAKKKLLLFLPHIRLCLFLDNHRASTREKKVRHMHSHTNMPCENKSAFIEPFTASWCLWRGAGSFQRNLLQIFLLGAKSDFLLRQVIVYVLGDVCQLFCNHGNMKFFQ